MINFVNWRVKVLFLIMMSPSILSKASAANSPPTTLLLSVPPQWQSIVKKACEDLPHEHEVAGIYYSNYVDEDYKLLILNAQGSYHLMFWDKRHLYDRSYIGSYKYEDGLTALDIHLNPNSLGSDSDEEKLVTMSNNAQRFLLLEASLDDIGASIQWDGTMGSSDNYYLQIACDQKLPIFDGDDLKAPPQSNFPTALKRFVFAHPVIAKIIALLEKTEGYDPVAKDNEFLVQINKGSNDSFRINMPLCSPKQSRQHLMGWVSDKIAPNHSEVRIEINAEKPGKPLVFPKVGDELSTSATECFEK